MNSEWSLCVEGLEQSPIDLANASAIELPGVDIHLPSDQEVEVLNQEGVIGSSPITGFAIHCAGV